MLRLLRKESGEPLTLPFTVNLFLLMFLLMAAFAVVIAFYNYNQTSRAALETADRLLAEATDKVAMRLEALIDPLTGIADLAPTIPDLAQKGDVAAHPLISYLLRTTEIYPQIYSVYLGYDDGDFLQVISASGDLADAVRTAHHAPEATRSIVRVIAHGADGRRRQVWRFLDQLGGLLAERIEDNPTYDPRARPWFARARGSAVRIVTDPYVFSSLGAPGLTVARRFDGESPGVLGVDLTLDSLSSFLANNKPSEHGVLALLDRSGSVFVRPATPAAGPTATLLVNDWLAADAQASQEGRLTPRLMADGTLVIGRLAFAPAEFGRDLRILALVPTEDFVGPIARIRHNSLLFTVLALLVTIPLALLLSRRVSTSIAAVVAETDRIRRFELDQPFVFHSRVTELHKLAVGVATMKEALATFGRYVPRALVRQIIQAGTPVELGGERREVTILFSDIVGFTPLSEGVDPEELMIRTSQYFEELTAAIGASHGAVDKYIGDAIMAMWNAPLIVPDHAAHACRAALEADRRSRAFSDALEARGLPRMDTRFGLHTGIAVVGNVGSSDRMNYTVIGTTVNLASRIEGLNKLYGTRILATEPVRQRAGAGLVFRLVDTVLPKGALSPFTVYELMGTEDILDDPDLTKVLEFWDRAREAYQARDFAKALGLLDKVQSLRSEDGPAGALRALAERYALQPPPADWTGVTIMAAK